MKIYESDELVEYVDFETIVRKEIENVYSVQEIVNFTTPRKLASGDLYNSLRIQAEYELTKNLRRSILKLACSDSMGGGNVLLRDENKSEWEEITKDSNNEKIKEIIIKKSKLNT